MLTSLYGSVTTPNGAYLRRYWVNKKNYIEEVHGWDIWNQRPRHGIKHSPTPTWVHYSIESRAPSVSLSTRLRLQIGKLRVPGNEFQMLTWRAIKHRAKANLYENKMKTLLKFNSPNLYSRWISTTRRDRATKLETRYRRIWSYSPTNCVYRVFQKCMTSFKLLYRQPILSSSTNVCQSYELQEKIQ